jgi:hypothetical protein
VSGRVVTGFRNGKPIRGYRKTDRVVVERRQPAAIPDWCLFFSLPAELRFSIADGNHGNVAIEKGCGTIIGKNQGWVLDQLAKFLIAVARDLREVRIDARLSRDDHGAVSAHPPKRGEDGYVEIVAASGRPVVVMASRYMRAVVRAE